MSEKIIIAIDGKEVSANVGEMLIQAADRAGIYIPRFCYHKKLKIAANCRMCLVEVTNVPKTLPACATPVMAGMKVFTRSKAALKSQQVVMEFLLANHPLDCPVCDQGGECELQDLAMSYGSDNSRYTSAKRAVHDEDLGPLVATEMTRCIHCTRCVRFCTDIAGVQDLGAFSRGGDMSIGTFLETGLQNELSGNVIDLCPVGALTSKPFRYTGRSWEFSQHLSVAPHDGVCSNIYIHTQSDNYGSKNKVMRVLPRENEAVNEIWISDRDSFSYLSLSAPDRVKQPMLKKNGVWASISWESALRYVADTLTSIKVGQQANKIGGLISSSSSCEEAFMFQKILRKIGSNNIDHRLSTACFADQENFSLYPGFSTPLASFADKKVIFLVGSFARQQQPLLFHRIRQAVNNGSKLVVINSYDYDFSCNIAAKYITGTKDILKTLVTINHMLAADIGFGSIDKRISILPEVIAVVSLLRSAGNDLAIIAGEKIESHVQGSQIRAWLYNIAKQLSGEFHQINKGSNSVGCWLAGAVPHRGELANDCQDIGLNAQQMVEEKLAVYLLHGIELDDFINPAAASIAFKEADIVINTNSFISQAAFEYSDVILPLAMPAEFSGSYINCAAQLQQFNTAIMPTAEAKPGWKIYRVLAELMQLQGFEYEHCSAITTKFQDYLLSVEGKVDSSRWNLSEPEYLDKNQLYGCGYWHPYRIDQMVRRSEPLQKLVLEKDNCVRVHPDFGNHLQVTDNASVVLEQEHFKGTYTCIYDAKVAYGDLYVAASSVNSINLLHVTAAMTITSGA